MKRFLDIAAAIVVGVVIGFFVAITIRNVTDDLPQYSPDRIIDTILERGSIVGASANDLPPAKGMVQSVFDGGGRTYFRQIIESPRFVLLKTVEDDKIIEVEIWDRTKHKAVFYEIDAEAMKRYSKFYPETE